MVGAPDDPCIYVNVWTDDLSRAHEMCLHDTEIAGMSEYEKELLLKLTRCLVKRHYTLIFKGSADGASEVFESPPPFTIRLICLGSRAKPVGC